MAACSAGAPGSADVPVGRANEKANDGAGHGRPLEPHSLAGEDAGVPGANEDVGAPECCSRGDLKKNNASATRVRRRFRNTRPLSRRFRGFDPVEKGGIFGPVDREGDFFIIPLPDDRDNLISGIARALDEIGIDCG